MPKRAALFVWFTLIVGLSLLGCGSEKQSNGDEAVATAHEALTVVAQHDFEDGALNGWIPRGAVTLTNTTEAAADGTHSLKTTGRSANFHGPSLDVLGRLTRGASYEISVKARLVAGEAPTTLRMTMQQTPTGGSAQFVTVAQAATATDAAWVTMTGTFSYGIDVSGLLLYVEATSATASYYIDSFSVTETIPPPAVGLSHDFENGTNHGWIPRGAVTLTNTDEAAADGLRSLKTTGRTAGFNGPSLNLLGVLRKGATYQVSVKARLVTGEAATTVRVTVQRTPTGASSAFDGVASANATDAAFVTLTGFYSFGTDVSGLLLYVEATSATASYYIDSFTLTELAPPPGPPGNTTGVLASFESGGTEGWSSRTGVEVVAVSDADAHTGTKSLLTTGRTASFRGPAFNVTNVMFNGSRYRVALWAKLAPGEADTQLRVSLERRLGSQPSTFHTLIGNTTVTANAWVRLSATFDLALANTGLTLYVESNGGAPLSSFYVDDVSITFVPPAVAERDLPSLKQTLAPFFPVGAAVVPSEITGEHAFLLTQHFASITSGNDMKWDALQRTEGTFTYATADAQVAFARTNGLRVRGHTLVWHNQTPAWVFNDASGSPLTPTPENKALVLARLEAHIRAVVPHFGTNVYAWDVVNEVIDPAQPDGFRRSPWFDIAGAEYIDRAFQVAREVAPTAELYINEFSTTNTLKRQFLYDLVRDLRARGIPVDGVGHQMHNNVDFPSNQAIIETIDLFHGLGVKQEITELDVSIYSNSLPGPLLEYSDIPADRFVAQGYRYRDFFQAFQELAGKINSITIWGQADDSTWLTSSTRVDAPLLFDTSLKAKPAFWGIVDPKQLAGADVAVSLDALAPSVAAGETLELALGVTNDGDDDAASYLPQDDDLPATNVSLVSALPPGTLFASLSSPPGWSCTTPAVGSSGQIACTLDSLAVNASEAFTLALKPTCAATDASTLSSSATVTSATRDPNPAPNSSASATAVVSNPPPVVTLVGGANMTLECRAPFVDPGANAVDACDGAVAVTTTGSVDTSSVGTSTLTYDASDSAGSHAVSLVRTVNVVDTTAPVVTLVGDATMTLECLAPFVDPGATAVDGCSGDLPTSLSGAVSGAVPSVSLLTYAATDASGNAGTATRSVVRRDTVAPVFDAVDLTLLLPGVRIVLNGGVITVNGQSFPLTGRTLRVLGQTITLNEGSLTVNGESFALDGRTVLLLLPLHQYQSFTIFDFIAALGPDCDQSLDLGDVVIERVTSDELDNAPGNGDGNTTSDIELAADCRSLRLRVERADAGNGRVYTVSLRVRDASGNTSTKSLKVIVPKNQGTGSSVDDGPKLTVTSACL